MAAPTFVSAGGTKTADGVPANQRTIAGVTPSGTSRAILVAVAMDWDVGNQPTVLSATLGAAGLTFLGGVNLPSSSGRIEWWGLVNPAASSATLTVTLSGSLSQEFGIGYLLLSAVDQASPFGAVTTATGTSTAPAVAVTQQNTDDLCYGLVSTQTTAASNTGSMTNRVSQLVNNSAPTLVAQCQVDELPGEGDLSTQMTWSKAGSEFWAAAGVPVHGLAARTASVTAAGTVTVTGRAGVRVAAQGSVAVASYGPDYALRTYIGLPGLTEMTFPDGTSRLRKFNITRGRTDPLSRIEAATGNATMKNGDGALDPSNVSSPFYPYVSVLSELVLVRRQAGTEYRRFTGRTERIVPDWITRDYQEQEFQGSDAFEALAALHLESGQATLTTTITGTNNDLVYTSREHGGRGDDLTVEYVVDGVNTALDGATNDPLDGGAYIEEQRPVLPRNTFWDGLRSGPPVSQFEVRGSDISINVSTDGSGNPTATAAQVKAFIDATPELSALVQVELAPGNSGAGVVAAMPKTNLSGGKWVQEKTGARINRALDMVGWPADKRRIDAGLCEVVAQGFAKRDKVSAIAHIQDVAASELGYVFMSTDGYLVYHDGGHRGRDPRSTAVQATFSDVTAGAGYLYKTVQPEYSQDRIYNRVSVTPGYSNAPAQVVEDTASQLRYSPVPGVPVPREYSLSTLLANDTDALLVAETILAAYKDAKPRFESIQLQERAVPAGWTEAIMAREIGDLIELRTKPPGHETVGVYQCYIEQVQEEGSPGQPVLVTFAVSLASESLDVPVPGGALHDSSGDDFVLDSGTQGVLG